jgi:hypothetical protein
MMLKTFCKKQCNYMYKNTVSINNPRVVLCYFLIRMYMAVKHVSKPSHFLLMVSGRGCSEFLAMESLLRRLITS